ncbi:MAG: hypothetical protein ACJASB_000713 [Shewanella psychromarinicola]|jgi:hypothetical protein
MFQWPYLTDCISVIILTLYLAVITETFTLMLIVASQVCCLIYQSKAADKK